MKKTIIIFGNCQGKVIAQCLSSIPLLNHQYDVIWERNVDLPGWPPKKELSGAQIENCTYLFEQLGRNTIEFPHKDKLPTDCMIVKYPYLKLECLWPLLALNDPRNKLEPPKYGAGRFPYGDRLVIAKMKNNVPREIIFDGYMQMNIKDHVDIDQRYQADLQRIKEVDDKCDVKVYNLFKEHFIDRRLFHTFCHPTSDAMKFLLLEILEKAGVIDRNRPFKEIQSSENSSLSDALVFGVTKFFDQPIFAAVQVPIHPHICQHLKLGWADGNTRYQYYDYGNLTFEEYMKLYIDYEDPEIEILNKIKDLLENEKFEEASGQISQALEKNPDSADLLNMKGELMVKTGKLEEAHKTFLSVTERWPDNSEALNNLAVVLCYEQKYDSAIKLLQRVLRLNPSNSDALENLKFIQNEVSILKAKDFMQKGNYFEAKTILEKILDTDEQNVEALNQLAVIYIKKGNLEEAEKKLSLVFKIDPTNEEATQNFIYLNQQRACHHG